MHLLFFTAFEEWVEAIAKRVGITWIIASLKKNSMIADF